MRITDQKTIFFLLFFPFLGIVFTALSYHPLPKDETVFPSSAFFLSGKERAAMKKGESDGTFRVPSDFKSDYQFLADLNRSGTPELALLPGIGPELSSRILGFRRQNDGFRSFEELLEVKGMGEKKMTAVRPFLKEIDSKLYPPRPEKEPLRININRDGKERLVLLPNIGPKTADRIIEYRNANGPFRSRHDLLNVDGIGLETFNGILPFLEELGRGEE